MAVQTFRNALYDEFQPADGSYDATFLIGLLEFLPIDRVDMGAGVYDAYLYDLMKTAVDNYEKGHNQVAFFYSHLIFMTYVYYSVEHAYRVQPERVTDVYFSLNAYLGRSDKPELDTFNSVYDFSKIPEKEIFKVFRALDMDKNHIKELSNYVKERDDFAHATGKGNLSETQLTDSIRRLVEKMEIIGRAFGRIQKEAYIQFLQDNCDCIYQDVYDSIDDFIVNHTLSLRDISSLCNMGISGIRDENENFRREYRKIKKVHCVFIEYCLENYGIDPPECYHSLRDLPYMFYRYQNNADRYVEEELGVSSYLCVKEGVEFPVYKCPCCGENQLTYNNETGAFLCFGCQRDYSVSLTFCADCGRVKEKSTFELCNECYRAEETGNL